MILYVILFKPAKTSVPAKEKPTFEGYTSKPCLVLILPTVKKLNNSGPSISLMKVKADTLRLFTLLQHDVLLDMNKFAV